MNILLVNDDGVLAPGLTALAQALAPLGRVVIMAPESERSGFASAITLDRPLKPVAIKPDVWAVNGTPADCVYLAMHNWLNIQFDLVISGINSGANISDDVLYSGTVGATVEATVQGCPALAISLAGPKVRAYQDISNYQQAAQWVHDFIVKGIPKLPTGYILNINIPDVANLQGQQVTQLSQRQLKQPLQAQQDARGRDVVWLSLLAQPIVTADLGSIYDHQALAAGYVSLTPIQMRSCTAQMLTDLQAQLASTGH